MVNLKEILAEAEELSLSTITDIQSGSFLNSVEFKQAIIERIKFISQYNVKSGQAVVLMDNNSIAFFVNFLALFCLRITCIPLDKSLHPDELKNVLDFIGPVLINQDNKWLTGPGIEHTALKDVTTVLFTSGTTSKPKGVLISRNALIEKIEVLDRHIPREDIKNTLCFIPTYFGHGLICNSLYPIFKSKNFYISPKLDIKSAASLHEVLTSHQITFFSSVPSHWELLLNFGTPTDAQLKRVHCASAPFKTERTKAVKDWIKNAPLFNVYGITEMLGWMAINELNENIQQLEFTHFLECERSLSANNELLVKSDYMFAGYWSEKGIDTPEFVNTGDIFIDNCIVGRSKNVVNKNGIKISTDEINADLMKSDLIKDAASFPVPDNFSGERIAVLIVLSSGSTVDKLKKYCLKNFSKDRVPSEFIVCDSIPVNARGKSPFALLLKFYEDHK